MSSVVQPNIKDVQTLTRRTFQGKLPDAEVQRFLDATTSRELPGFKHEMGILGGQGPVGAHGSMWFGLFFGKVTCTPDGLPYKFDEYAYGLGALKVESGGVLYTALSTWEEFFQETVAYHAQAGAEALGILQINFFNSKGLPIGQFNGVAGGAGLVECGGSGRWHKK